jgi:phospholipid N-methyltransferase
MKSLFNKLARKLSRNAQANLPLDKRLVTSITDNQRYPQVCIDASNNYNCFNSFRRNHSYVETLEHVTYDEGVAYLAQIRKRPNVFSRLPAIARNDDYGSPILHHYEDVIVPISPTTLRYAKVLCDLTDLFGSIDGLHVAEIGVGYGGQCRAINAISRPASYTLIDLQPALQLAQRYLDHYILGSTLRYLTLNQLAPQKYDLFMSNYALTELTREVQDAYLEKVVLGSSRGYITYNQISPDHFRSYSVDELLEIIPGSVRFDEIPLTHPDNCIIAWGCSGFLDAV